MMELIERLLLEKSRRELISKSQGADITSTYGTTRWDRRNSVRTFPTVEQNNSIDFNALFKANLLNMVIPVHGDRALGSKEDYSVEILFEGVCDKLKQELKRNNNRLEYKIVYRAIINAINAGDVLISCTCNDWKYRQAYQGTMGRYNAGKPELRPTKITNPNDSKGAGCKHVLNVLGNLDWAMGLATSITNYCFYMKDHYPELFKQVIWPAISDVQYEQAEEDGYLTDLATTMTDSEATVEEPEVEEPIEEPEEEPMIDSEGEANATEL